MKIVLVLFVVIVCSMTASAQNTFRKIFSSGHDEQGYSVLQTNDGGYAVCGSTVVNYIHYCYLIKTDQNGDTTWTKKIPAEVHSYESIFKQTSDSGFIICVSPIGIFSDQVLLIKTDLNGDTVWTRVFTNGVGYAIEITPDHGFIITGRNGLGTFILKTDSLGNEIWRKTYHPYGTISAHSAGTAVCCTNDNGYMIAGTYDYNPTWGDTHFIFIIKLNALGDSLWGGLFNQYVFQVTSSVHQTADSGYIIGGSMSLYGYDATFGYIIKTNETGDTAWTRSYGSNSESIYTSLQVMESGDYIACGKANIGSEDHILLERIGQEGDLQWSRIFPMGSNSMAWSVRAATDGGSVLCGRTITSPQTNYNIVLLKTDINGTLTTINDQLQKTSFGLNIFPNPCSSFVQLSYRIEESGPVRIEILNCLGVILKTHINFDNNVGSHTILLPVDDLVPGIYLCRITANGFTETKQLLVQR